MDYIFFALYVVPAVALFLYLLPEINQLLAGTHTVKPNNPRLTVTLTVLTCLVPVMNAVLLVRMFWDEYEKQRDKNDS